jgi:hypothetical protein
VIDTLSRLREPNPSPFHYVSDIPAPPEAYVAHPYTLLQTGHLIGRQTELNELTEWVTKSDKPVFNVVAIGGMGKSALTWHWFNKVAPLEMKPLAGRMWWSFYESDATFENFVIRALAYVTKRPREEVQKIPVTDREEQLAGSAESRAVSGRAGWAGAHPDRLCAHGRGATFRRGGRARGRSAAQDRRSTCRRISAQGLGLPRGAPADQHPLYPADLEDRFTGDPLPECGNLDLRGLSDDDALNLWRAFGVSGTRDALLPVLRSFGKHPLLIQALAGEIKRDRRANGDFERWHRDHPRFDPMALAGVKDASAHVLKFALQGLSESEGKALRTGGRIPDAGLLRYFGRCTCG